MLGAIAMALTLLLVVGMGQRGNAPVPELRVAVLLSGTRDTAERTEPSAAWITSGAELERSIDRLGALQLPAEDMQALIAVDLAAYRILLIGMGQKPTAGYGLELAPESCSLAERNARISLVWREPAQGMVTAQVITHPFILLKVSKGGYDAVQVVDQHGQVRFDLPVPQGIEKQ